MAAGMIWWAGLASPRIIILKRDLTCSGFSDIIAMKIGKKVSAPTISRALSRQADEQSRGDVQKKRARHKFRQKHLSPKLSAAQTTIQPGDEEFCF